MPIKKAIKKKVTAPVSVSIIDRVIDSVAETNGPEADLLDDDLDMYQEPIKTIVVPANQLTLTPAELKVEVTRVLTANDPNVPCNITKYNYKDRMYKVDPPGPGDHLYLHLEMAGSAMHKDSEDAKAQASYNLKKLEEEQELRQEGLTIAREEAEARGEKIDESTLVFDSGKNQFNYSERASQTFTNPQRQRSVETEPPPVMGFTANVTQWDIYDAYMGSYEQAQRDTHQLQKQGTKKEELDAMDDMAAAAGLSIQTHHGKEDDVDTIHSVPMGKGLKIIERMVNQNAEDEIFQDFKYWEDASDQFREGEGSLLPLWRFSSDRAKKKQVTALCWNSAFSDLFAVGYGSYEFLKQGGSGMVCCYSLKNTSHPEYTFTTESGVMCLDFHPQHPALIAVGCYDGTVMVFDVRNKVNRPIYLSTIRTGKHTDPVWQVSWQAEDLAKELNFFSISSDGRVANWIMSKNELKMEPVMALKLVGSGKSDPEEASLSGLANGCCFDFNKQSEHLFIVGTEEGKIHKCSKAHSGQYLENYTGHYMAVYAVRWNPFHPRVFISCSADWTVKIWDHTLPHPIMSFDLGNAVGDVAWAPYSSTIFAAVTSDGKVHVFDLAENKHEPLCEQKVVKRAKLTHVIFNSKDPIILVGDERGGVNSLKLSPNLRKIQSITSGSATTTTPEVVPAPADPVTTGEDGAPPAPSGGSSVVEREITEAQQIQIDKFEKLLIAVESKPV